MAQTYSSKKLLQKKKKMFKWKMIISIILFIGIFIGFVYWMNHPSMNISSVEINETELVLVDDIQRQIGEIINEKAFFVFPKTNFLFIPKNEIRDSLKQSPPIKSVDFNLKNKKLAVKVEEYEPVILWCTGAGNNCRLVNEEGIVFYGWSLLHSLQDLIKFRQDGVEIWDGDVVIDKFFMQSILVFVDGLKDFNIKVFEINYSGEDIYRIHTSKGFDIVLSSQDDLDKAFENIKTIFEKETFKQDDLSLIDYIDLRFGNKIFYKLKD